jgi:hypothetical protein
MHGQRTIGLTVRSKSIAKNLFSSFAANAFGFVNDAAGRRYAIYASAFTVHRLSDEVINRWLSEPCPSERQTADQEAAHTRFENGSSTSTSTPNAK